MNQLTRTQAIGVEAVGIGKHFGSFHALSEVSLKVMPALCTVCSAKTARANPPW